MNMSTGQTVYRGFTVSEIGKIKEKWQTIRKDRRLSENSTFRSYIESLNFESLEGASGSLIISATFTPVRHSAVRFRGKRVIIPTPHQYYETSFTALSVGSEIAAHEDLSGDLRQITDIPLKLGASMCGLTRYGRNNISYTDKFGSYITLMAFHTEEKCFERELEEPRRLDLCSRCRKCVEVCPGSALEEPYLLVDRCLTLFNEIEGDFPDRIKSMPHHTLMGCLICQKNCPANRGVKAVSEGPSLDEEETEALYRREMSSAGLKGLEKLIGICDPESLKHYFPVYARNFHYALRSLCGCDSSL